MQVDEGGCTAVWRAVAVPCEDVLNGCRAEVTVQMFGNLVASGVVGIFSFAG